MVPNPDKDIVTAWGSSNVLGVTAQRSTFLVDPQGRIAHVWPKVSIDGHADDVVRTMPSACVGGLERQARSLRRPAPPGPAFVAQQRRGRSRTPP